MNKILKFDCKEFESICFGHHKDFELIERIDGERDRWSVQIIIIVKQLSTGLHYMGYYEEGATECQDDEFSIPELTRCKPVEVKRIEWEEID